jgi:hypothetical protein
LDSTSPARTLPLSEKRLRWLDALTPYLNKGA